MGNKLRRPSKPSVDLSANSSKSSGISPKATPNKSATMAAKASHTVAGQAGAADKQGTSSADAHHVVEVQKKNELPELPFKSYLNGGIPENDKFQGHKWQPKQKTVTTKAYSLSAKSPILVPYPQDKQNQTSTGPGRFGAQQISFKKPGQPGAFGSSRHTHRGIPQPKASASVSKLQDLIKEFPPYNPATHVKGLSEGSNISGNSSLSAISVATSRTTTSPSPHKIRENVVVRVDKRKKDLVIHANGFTLNRVHVDEYMLQDGKLTWAPHGGFNPTNILSEIAEKDEAGKEHFWLNHHVQIEVDLRNVSIKPIIETTTDPNGKAKEVAPITPPNIIDQLARLGKDFTKYATNITVNIIFPPARDGSVAPFPRAISDRKWNYPDFNIAVSTLGFAIIKSLIAKLDNCLSLSLLEVIIHNPNASTTLPFNVEQLFHCLPFYDLRFEDWEIKWQGNYMSEAVDVGHFPILLLDKERNRWMWAQKKEKREQEIKPRIEQERINNMVFVRKSAAPEFSWKKYALLEPFPKPKDSLAQDKAEKDSQDKEDL